MNFHSSTDFYYSENSLDKIKHIHGSELLLFCSISFSQNWVQAG